MPLEGHFLLSLKGHSYWERFLRSRKKSNVTLILNKKKGKDPGTTAQPISLDPREGEVASNSGNNFQTH